MKEVCSAGNFEILKLVHSFKSFDKIDDSGLTCLHYAVRNGQNQFL